MFTKLVSSSWAIHRSERDKFASCTAKIIYDSGKAVSIFRNVLEKNFQKKDLGSLKYGELSVVTKLLSNYFGKIIPSRYLIFQGLIGADYLRTICVPLFSKPSFERDLCFDLRSKTEDQSVNQLEFVKLAKSLVEPLFSIEMLDKIPSEIR